MTILDWIPVPNKCSTVGSGMELESRSKEWTIRRMGIPEFNELTKGETRDKIILKPAPRASRFKRAVLAIKKGNYDCHCCRKGVLQDHFRIVHKCTYEGCSHECCETCFDSDTQTCLDSERCHPSMTEDTSGSTTAATSGLDKLCAALVCGSSSSTLRIRKVGSDILDGDAVQHASEAPIKIDQVHQKQETKEEPPQRNHL